jgi:aryl-alcohol dehydrogenase-like predicted oxidoreductase
MENPFERTLLGRTGLNVSRLGMSASYGMPAAAVEYAFERGVNYIYWGSLRRKAFGAGIRNLSNRREQMVLVVQSYSPFGSYLGRSVEGALRTLRFDYADVLLLGMWNRPVPDRVLDSARRLKERGLVRFLGLSTHQRPLVPQLAPQDDYDLFHVRYNAVHTGAERDVFPHLPADRPPGIVSFTATSWGQLLRHRRIPKQERQPTAGDCYRFVLSNPAVDVCMTGVANMEQTKHALEALKSGPMSENELAWMRKVGAAIYGKT